MLSAFICGAKTTVVSIRLSCQFVKLNKDKQWLGELRVVVHTVPPTGSCADCAVLTTPPLRPHGQVPATPSEPAQR